MRSQWFRVKTSKESALKFDKGKGLLSPVNESENPNPGKNMYILLIIKDKFNFFLVYFLFDKLINILSSIPSNIC